MRRSKKSTAAETSTVDIYRTRFCAGRIEAVATSTLSKRWIHLWHHVPNLNFPFPYAGTFNTIGSDLLFNQSVYSVLLSREAAIGSNVIDGFTLDIRYRNTFLAKLGLPNINKWMNLVVQRKLKYLYLHLHVEYLDDGYVDDYDIDFPKLPVSIFTCRTLVSLNLRWFRVEGFSFSSNGFQFPSLKTLHLKSVYFSKVRDFMLFIAGCPILEDLQIIEMDFLPFEEDSLTLQEFKRLSLPNLKRAKFSIHCHCFPVNALSTAKYLYIYTFKVLNIVKYLYTQDPKMFKVNLLQHPYDVVPIFHNLTHLELLNRWDLVVQVLHQCPKLQNLKFDETLYDDMPYEEGHQKNWVEPEFVPQCLLSSLTTCAISIEKSELLLEQYILKNARILQTMTIRGMIMNPEMKRKLSMCPKASATCQISLY